MVWSKKLPWDVRIICPLEFDISRTVCFVECWISGFIVISSGNTSHRSNVSSMFEAKCYRQNDRSDRGMISYTWYLQVNCHLLVIIQLLSVL